MINKIIFFVFFLELINSEKDNLKIEVSEINKNFDLNNSENLKKTIILMQKIKKTNPEEFIEKKMEKSLEILTLKKFFNEFKNTLKKVEDDLNNNIITFCNNLFDSTKTTKYCKKTTKNSIFEQITKNLKPKNK